MRKRLIEKFLRSYFRFHRLVDASCTCPGALKRLNRAQIELLYALHKHASMTIGQIAANCATTSSAATQMVESMDQLGLIARAEDPSDRRVVRISLSTTGHKFYQQFHTKHIELIDNYMKGVSVDELQTLIRIQDKIQSVLEERSVRT